MGGSSCCSGHSHHTHACPGGTRCGVASDLTETCTHDGDCGSNCCSGHSHHTHACPGGTRCGVASNLTEACVGNGKCQKERSVPCCIGVHERDGDCASGWRC